MLLLIGSLANTSQSSFNMRFHQQFKILLYKVAASPKFLWPVYRPEKKVFKIKMLMQHELQQAS